jgi:hypothetical protein
MSTTLDQLRERMEAMPTVLDEAWRLKERIDDLVAQQDRLLGPVADQMMEQIRVAPLELRSELIARVRRLPPGFYRSELLTAINVRYATMLDHV